MFTKNSFIIKSGQYDLKSYNECTTKYVSDFENAISLKGDLPIFLDANVILRYYSISFNAREKLFEFLKSNIDRIYLTAQVQKEILKNRGDNIKKFFQQVSKKVPQEFTSDIVNQLQNFLEQHKTILKDYPYMETELSTHKKQLEELLQKLNDDTRTKYEENKTLVWKDKLLDLLCEANLREPLTTEEITQISKDFDILKKGIDIGKIDNLLNKSSSVFPGLGDIKEKPDDPYGDFIIYHEILKFQFEKKCSSVFLTFDNTKGDWMSKSKEPYLHYVYNMYLNTDCLLYIVDAERTLEKILEINIDSLIIDQSPKIENVLNKANINILFKTHPIFKNHRFRLCDDKLEDQLIKSGYETIDQLSSYMDKLSTLLPEVLENNPSLNSIGVLRYGMRIFDEKFDKTTQAGLTYSVDTELEHYRYLLNVRSE